MVMSGFIMLSNMQIPWYITAVLFTLVFVIIPLLITKYGHK